MVKEAVKHYNEIDCMGLNEENIFIIAQEIERFFKYFILSEYISAETDLLIVPTEKENDTQEVFIRAIVTVNRKTAKDNNIDYVFNLERLTLDEFLDEMNRQKDLLDSGKQKEFK